MARDGQGQSVRQDGNAQEQTARASRERRKGQRIGRPGRQASARERSRRAFVASNWPISRFHVANLPFPARRRSYLSPAQQVLP